MEGTKKLFTNLSNLYLCSLPRNQTQTLIQKKRKRRKKKKGRRCAPQSALEQINATMRTLIRLQKKKACSATARPEPM